MPEQVKKSLVISIYFALAASTLLVFWQVWNFDFVNYDDNKYVYENQHVTSGLTFSNIVWAFTATDAANWHPLTWLSLMLDCQLFGPSPGKMHLVNLFLHLVNALLLFAVLKKMTGSLWPSAFVAAAFALHPMHVESVAWITERKDVLSALFMLLTLAAYVGYTNRPSVFRYVATLVLFALGLMAKPMLVTLPFVLLLLDYWPLSRLTSQITETSRRRGRKSTPAADKYRIIIEKIPFFVLSAISSVITFLAQRGGGALGNTTVLALKYRIANTLMSYVRYIAKMFWPQNLAVFYPFDAAYVPFWQVAMCALPLLGVSFFVLRFGRKQKYLLVGWFWFIATLIPVIGIVQVGSQAYADRYTYIPYIGLFIMLAWALPQLLSNWPYRKILLGTSMMIVLLALGISSHRQTSFWNNSVTIFSHALEVTQNNYIAFNNAGLAYDNLGLWQVAVNDFSQAIKIKPDYAEAHTNLGIVYSRLGRYQEAIEAYKQAISIKPDYAEAHYNLANILGIEGEPDEAVDQFREVLRLKPDWPKPMNNLAQFIATHPELKGRDVDEAICLARRACELTNYKHLAYLGTLTSAYTSAGRFAEAIDTAKTILNIEPNNPGVKNNLAWILATSSDPNMRDPSNAIRFAKEACNTTNYKQPGMLDTLGAAYASAGRFHEAVDTTQKAIRLADSTNQPQLKDIIQYHLTFYKQSKPYIEPAPKLLPDPNKS